MGAVYVNRDLYCLEFQTAVSAYLKHDNRHAFVKRNLHLMYDLPTKETAVLARENYIWCMNI